MALLSFVHRIRTAIRRYSSPALSLVPFSAFFQLVLESWASILGNHAGSKRDYLRRETVCVFSPDFSFFSVLLDFGLLKSVQAMPCS
jgi:hypothetical protein